jgi:tight adherence protein B
MAIVIGIFVVVVAIVFGAYWLVIVRQEEQETRAVRQRLGGKIRAPLGARLVKTTEHLSGIPTFENALARSTALTNPLKVLIERSGAKYTVGRIILSAAFLGGAAATVTIVLLGSWLIGLVAAVLASSLPVLYLRHIVSKRLAVFEEQFPEAIDLMARALRAGHALPTALELVANEVPAPIGPEFRLLFDQQNYGLSMPDALRAFADRVPLIDARFFVTAVLTQREMGGNLSEVLDKLAAVIRERFTVKRQVRAVSAHGRITGTVLGALPLAIAAALLVVSPSHLSILINDPLGVNMIIAGVALELIGIVWIKTVINVEY